MRSIRTARPGPSETGGVSLETRSRAPHSFEQGLAGLGVTVPGGGAFHQTDLSLSLLPALRRLLART